MSIISLDEVSKIYGFGSATTVALEEVSLEIKSGEFIAVMGPSGSGKSTLLNILGLLDHPTSGAYKLEGKFVSRLPNWRKAKVRREKVGFVFQSFNLLDRLNAIENIALPLAYGRMSARKRQAKALVLLERVGLDDRSHFYPPQLSGGQNQRVAIARALVNDPKIIIADEPTGNLDSEASRVVMELLQDVHKTGSTIIMVTHNPELTRYATRVLYMHDGQIVHDEKNRVGQVAHRAKRKMIFVNRPTVDDDMAGVSAVMKAIPSKGGQPTKKTKAKRSRGKKFKYSKNKGAKK